MGLRPFCSPEKAECAAQDDRYVLSGARRRTGEKVSSKRDGEAVTITSNKRPNIKSVFDCRIANDPASISPAFQYAKKNRS